MKKKNFVMAFILGLNLLGTSAFAAHDLRVFAGKYEEINCWRRSGRIYVKIDKTIRPNALEVWFYEEEAHAESYSIGGNKLVWLSPTHVKIFEDSKFLVDFNLTDKQLVITDRYYGTEECVLKKVL